jgi:large subunit ribosomal protein L13
MSTYFPKEGEIARKWFVVDATDQTLGRLASKIARILMGKENPQYTTFLDTGDHVIVINARGVRLSGSKLEGKLYQHHSGYPGGLKTVSYDRLMSERPTMVVEKAVRGMLPKNRLGRKMIGKLSVYEGAEHPHAAQLPVPLGLGEIPPWTGLPAPPEPKAPAEPKAAEPKSRARGRTASDAKETAGAKRPTRAPRAKAADAPKSGTTRRSGTSTREKKEAPAAAAKKESGAAATPKTAATRSHAKATKDDNES